jgi:hypothetical protein
LRRTEIENNNGRQEQGLRRRGLRRTEIKKNGGWEKQMLGRKEAVKSRG